MRQLGRRLRAEYRKAGLTVVLGGPIALALASIVMKRTHARNPELLDANAVPGALQVAVHQHATLLGWLLVSVFVARGTAAEFGNGAWELSCAAAGGVHRVLVAKAIAIPLGVLCSEFLTTGLLRVSALAAPRWFGGRALPGMGGVLESLLRSLLVAEWLALAACLVAALSSSLVLTAVLPPALLTVTTRWTWDVASWATPARWMTELMRPSVFGEGADFFGNASGQANHSLRALTLLASTGAALALAVLWSAGRPAERRASS